MQINIDTLIAKKLSGNITAAEDAQLQDWIRLSPANAGHFSQLRSIWQLTGQLEIKDQAADVDKAWADFSQRASVRKLRPLRPRVYLRAAAVIIGLLFLIIMLRVLIMPEAQTPLMAEKATAHADTFEVSESVAPEVGDSVARDSHGVAPATLAKAITKTKKRSGPQIAMIAVSSEDSAMLFTLPDGSKVYLNTNSKLVYPERFAAASNEIYLSGEAYFEPVSEELFVICHETRTRSMGSAVNIKGLRDGAVEVSAIKGNVEVTRTYDAARQIVLVKEGEQLRYHAASHSVTKEKVSRRDKWWKHRSFRSIIKDFFSKIIPNRKNK